MPATSHFIGLRLRSAPLADIFAALQATLGYGVVEFQNILSAHVTLYYLPADISIDSARILSAAR